MRQANNAEFVFSEIVSVQQKAGEGDNCRDHNLPPQKKNVALTENNVPKKQLPNETVKEYARFKSRIAGQSLTELQHSFYPSKNSKVMKNKNTRSPFTDRIHFLVRLCSWARQSVKIPCFVWMCGMWTTNCFADERKTIFILFDFWIRNRPVCETVCYWKHGPGLYQLSCVSVYVHFWRIARLRNSFHVPLIVSWLENTRNNLSLHFTDPWPVLLLSATRRRSLHRVFRLWVWACASPYFGVLTGVGCVGGVYTGKYDDFLSAAAKTFSAKHLFSYQLDYNVSGGICK